jgi:tetratricopeptide (TPR) repeat protein
VLKSLLFTAALAGVAVAQPAPPADPKIEAKAHFDKGNTHYNLGEFDEAIAEFKTAYELSSAPGLLFNIAQSYRLKKDYEQANQFYKTYLRLKPDAANRAEVEERIKEMEHLIEEQKANAVSPPHGTIPPEGDGGGKPVDAHPIEPKPELKIDRGEHDDGRSLKTAGIATAATGGALIITGLVFGGMASSAASDLDKLSPDHGTWTTAQQDKYDAGKRDNTIAIISFVAGGAALATGGALWYLGYHKDSSTSVAIVPTRGGTAVAVGWRF